MDTQPQATRELPDNLHIIGIKGSNFKVLEAIDITLDDKGNLIPISGPNGAGKSSLIDLVWAVLGGKNALPGKPIRDGETEMVGKVTLGNGKDVALIVTRKATKKGDSTTHSLKVVTADGSEVQSPQAVLDAVVGQFTFDPLDFYYMKDADRTIQLLDMLGLTAELDKLDAETKSKEMERTVVGRERDQAKGQLAGLKAPGADTPSEVVDTAAVLLEIDQAQGVMNKRDHLVNDIAARAEGIQRDKTEMIRLNEELQKLGDRLVENEAAMAKAQGHLQGLSAVDIDALRNKLANAEHTNNAVRDAETYKAVNAKRQQKSDEYDALTSEIDKLRKAPEALLKKADIGIEGMDIRERVIHINGIPLDQISSSEKLVVCMKIAMLSNPTLRTMFIRDGSLTDTAHRALIAKLATDNNYQVLMELVADTGTGIGFELNEGRIVHEPEAVTA